MSNKLILGTAEWNPQGYNGDPALSIKEIRKILSCAKEAGINIIDTADSYNCHDVIKKEAKGFCVYTKTRDWKVNLDWGDNELRGILYHYQKNEKPIQLPFVHRWVNLGVSIYTAEQVPEMRRIVQIPLSLYDSQFTYLFESHRTVFVRSVFARGKLLKDRHTVKECLNYVKNYRSDGIIVGVKSSKELEEIVKAYGRD